MKRIVQLQESRVFSQESNVGIVTRHSFGGEAVVYASDMGGG